MKDKNGNIITEENKIMGRWKKKSGKLAGIIISQEEVEKAIVKLKLHKVGETDKIKAKMRKYLVKMERTYQVGKQRKEST